MYLITGLGNIGDEYKKTRHNVGFDVVDLISCRYNIPVNRVKFKGMCGEGEICGNRVMLLKPSTYMNLSGESVSEAVNFYKLENKNIIIVHDDISLECGRLRIRIKGSSGGHNGIKSIINCLGSDEFVRIKVGVGQPKCDLVSHVLGKFSKDEREIVEKVFSISADAVEMIIKEGSCEAMNKFNGLFID